MYFFIKQIENVKQLSLIKKMVLKRFSHKDWFPKEASVYQLPLSFSILSFHCYHHSDLPQRYKIHCHSSATRKSSHPLTVVLVCSFPFRYFCIIWWRNFAMLTLAPFLIAFAPWSSRTHCNLSNPIIVGLIFNFIILS